MRYQILAIDYDGTLAKNGVVDKSTVEALRRLLETGSRLGRPHWLFLDEAHHLLPADWLPLSGLLPDKLKSMVLITVHPKMLNESFLQTTSNP